MWPRTSECPILGEGCEKPRGLWRRERAQGRVLSAGSAHLVPGKSMSSCLHDHVAQLLSNCAHMSILETVLRALPGTGAKGWQPAHCWYHASAQLSCKTEGQGCYCQPSVLLVLSIRELRFACAFPSQDQGWIQTFDPSVLGQEDGLSLKPSPWVIIVQMPHKDPHRFNGRSQLKKKKQKNVRNL